MRRVCSGTLVHYAQTVKLSGKARWRAPAPPLPLMATAPRPPLAEPAPAPAPSDSFMDADFRTQGRRISQQRGQVERLTEQVDSPIYTALWLVEKLPLVAAALPS